MPPLVILIKIKKDVFPLVDSVWLDIIGMLRVKEREMGMVWREPDGTNHTVIKLNHYLKALLSESEKGARAG